MSVFNSEVFQGKFWSFFKRNENPENELKNLSKYEKILDSEKQTLEGNIRQSLNKSALKAFQFSESYAECYDQCASNALRTTLKNTSLESLLPDEVKSGTSKDLLTVQDNPAEKSLKELAGQVLDQNLFEPPKPNPEFFVKQKLDKPLRETVRDSELKCETHCAKKFYNTFFE
uniref:Uncharacterized protein n=1 Tax=Theileria annulata TaxID=5874 RepID=A0A3B0MJ94_THEAN